MKENQGEEGQEVLGEVKEGKREDPTVKKEEKRARADEEKAPSPSNEEILKKALAEERAEKEKWMNKFYQELADVQNLRKEIERDNQTLLEYRAMPFIEKLVPFLVNMEMGFKGEPKDPKVKSWMDGMHMNYRQLWGILNQEGLYEIQPREGERFDPSSMEAMGVCEGPVPDLVGKVMIKGYRFKKRVVVPAMVEITKLPSKGAGNGETASEEEKDRGQEAKKSDREDGKDEKKS